VRNNAQNPNLPRWIGGRGNGPVSAPATTSASAAAADGELSGRIHGRRGSDLPSSAAATASTSDPPFGRTGLILKGRRTASAQYLGI